MEPLEKSSHTPGPEREGAGVRDAPARSMGGDSIDRSPVLFRTARGATVGKKGTHGEGLRTSTPGFVGKNSPPDSCHHSALPPEALEPSDLRSDRRSHGGQQGSGGSLLLRVPLQGNPLGATCWARDLGRRRGIVWPCRQLRASSRQWGRGWPCEVEGRA